jgi:hypothetical protein
MRIEMLMDRAGPEGLMAKGSIQDRPEFWARQLIAQGAAREYTLPPIVTPALDTPGRPAKAAERPVAPPVKDKGRKNQVRGRKASAL